MPTSKRLISAVEAAEKIMNKWSDDKSNVVDIVILRPGNVDSSTEGEEVQDEDIIIDNGLPSHIYGKIQVQIIFLNGENNDVEVEDNDNAKEEQIEQRAKN